jgi:cold-inducible RNA-binding protein
MGSKLFVGGLAWTTDSEALRAAFQAHGEVVEAKVITDRETGRSRGFGFVTYATEAEAKKALAMNGAELDGRTLRVDLANESSRGGGGGRGGGRDRY